MFHYDNLLHIQSKLAASQTASTTNQPQNIPVSNSVAANQKTRYNIYVIFNK